MSLEHRDQDVVDGRCEGRLFGFSVRDAIRTGSVPGGSRMARPSVARMRRQVADANDIPLWEVEFVRMHAVSNDDLNDPATLRADDAFRADLSARIKAHRQGTA